MISFTMRLKKNVVCVPIAISIMGILLVLMNYQRETTESDSPQDSVQSRVMKSSVSIADKSNEHDLVKSRAVEEDSEEFLVALESNETSISDVPHIQMKYNFEDVQRQRRTHIEDACDRLNHTRSFPAVSWDSTVHFIISDKFKFMFCFVPKIACTTWKGIMIEVYHNQVGPTKKRFLKLDEIKSHAEVTRRWRDYKNVVFVREPLARVLSAYLDKFRNGKEKASWEKRFGGQIANAARRNDPHKRLNKDFTFVEFIKFILNLGPDTKMNQMKDHWLPYSSFTSPCQVKYDYIGHFETLARDGPAIIKSLGVEDIVQFPEVHGSAAIDGLQKEYANVPIDLILKLQEYYKIDYQLFGYSKEESLKLVLGNRTRMHSN